MPAGFPHYWSANVPVEETLTGNVTPAILPRSVRERKEPSVSKPISLTDDQMNAILSASAPLTSPRDRSAFLTSVAAYFRGRTEIGDGELFRVIAELQRGYFKAPTMNETRAPHQKRVGRIAS